MRRSSNRETSRSNATWSNLDQSDQKRAKSERSLLQRSKSIDESSFQELLSSLHSSEFCGKIDPTVNFDHSLKYNEWIRLPNGRNKSEKTKRCIIATPMEMYEGQVDTCDITVSSATSSDSDRKRRRHEMCHDESKSITGAFNSMTLGTTSSSIACVPNTSTCSTWRTLLEHPVKCGFYSIILPSPSKQQYKII
jgi:hypothetical protein